MLQQDTLQDFVIATGRQESVRRFIELSAAELGWGGIDWQGKGLHEKGLRADTGEVVVRIDPRYFRPAEVETLWRPWPRRSWAGPPPRLWKNLLLRWLLQIGKTPTKRLSLNVRVLM